LQLFLGNTVFMRMQDEVFAWNLVVKYRGHFEFFFIFKLIVTVLLTEPNNISLLLSRSLNTCVESSMRQEILKSVYFCVFMVKNRWYRITNADLIKHINDQMLRTTLPSPLHCNGCSILFSV
jgi:hypothetical protein